MSNPYSGEEGSIGSIGSTGTTGSTGSIVNKRELSEEEIEANRKANRKIAEDLKMLKESGNKKVSLAAVGQLLSRAKFNPKIKSAKSAKE